MYLVSISKKKNSKIVSYFYTSYFWHEEIDFWDITFLEIGGYDNFLS
jgi:hypothetical protein